MKKNGCAEEDISQIEQMKLAVLSQVTEAMDPDVLQPNEDIFRPEFYDKLNNSEHKNGEFSIDDKFFIKNAWPLLSCLSIGGDGLGTYFCMERNCLLKLIFGSSVPTERISFATKRFRVRQPEAWCWLAKGLVVESESMSIALDTKATADTVSTNLKNLIKGEIWMLPSRAICHTNNTHQIANGTVYYVMLAPGAVVAARFLKDLFTNETNHKEATRFLSSSLSQPSPRWDSLNNTLDASAVRALWINLNHQRRILLLHSLLEAAASSTLWSQQSLSIEERLNQAQALLLAALRRVVSAFGNLTFSDSFIELAKYDQIGDYLAEVVCLPRLVDMAATPPGTKNPLRDILQNSWLELRAELAQRAADELLLEDNTTKTTSSHRNEKKRRQNSKKRNDKRILSQQQHLEDKKEGTIDESKQVIERVDQSFKESFEDNGDDNHDDVGWQQVPSSNRRGRQKAALPKKIIHPVMRSPEKKEVDTILLASEVIEMAEGLRGIAQLRESYQLGACARLRAVAQRLWPSARLDVYGSVITGLAVPASDVDAVVSRVPQFWWTLKPKQQPLNVLAAELKLESWVSSTKIVMGAVPLVKIETAPVPTRHGNRSTIKMDVSFVHHSPFASTPVASIQHSHDHQGSSLGHYLAYYRSLHWHGTTDIDSAGMANGNHLNGATGGNVLVNSSSSDVPDHMPGCASSSGDAVGRGTIHSGVANTLFMLKLRCMFPELAPLVLVLKQLLYERGLNDPYAGGLSSYALVIMVAAVVQRYALTPPQQRPNLGALLLDTLSTYGTKSFDARKCSVQICATGPLVPLTPALTAGHVPRVGTREFFQPADPVVIQDPVDPKNNVGKSCFGFRQVQQAFDHALTAIKSFSAQDTADHRSALGAVFGADGETKHHDFVIRHLRAVWCPAEAAGLDDKSLEEIEELRALLNTRLPLSHVDISKVQRTMRSLQAQAAGTTASASNTVNHPSGKIESSGSGFPEFKEEPRSESQQLLDLENLNAPQLRCLAAGLRDVLLQEYRTKATQVVTIGTSPSSPKQPLSPETLATIEHDVLRRANLLGSTAVNDDGKTRR